MKGFVVDTCIFIDILLCDPFFGKASAVCLKEMQSQGLVVSPVCYIELAPAFKGAQQEQDAFLRRLRADFNQPWMRDDTLAAYAGWARYAHLKRKGDIAKRPVADVLIGAFASRFDGLITRNGSDFKKLFPTLTIIAPNVTAESGFSG